MDYYYSPSPIAKALHCRAVRFTLLLILTISGYIGNAQNASYSLIPYPTSLKEGSGKFTVTQNTRLVVSKGKVSFAAEAEHLQNLFENALGQKLASAKIASEQRIVLQFDTTIPQNEGYQIKITPQQMILAASNPAGMFRAVQTIRQLMPVSAEGQTTGNTSEVSFPALEIQDAPAFDWRGLHLDVSRHFFSTDYVKRLLDLMALYKFNKFHMHLTDDQGWRIEIKHYPKLTEEGAWRTFNNQDSVCMERAKENPDMEIDPKHIREQNGKKQYGGFYTQEEIKDIIQYAADRHIEVIPEIDMPGHMMAAIQAYPELACTQDIGWGKLFSVPVCPCNETIYEFADNVFGEIAELFPSPYIHVGADEVEKTTWANSDQCQQLMKEEGLESVEELQSYFVHKIQKIFTDKGKKLIGWDDMLEGGIDSTATVMYWRSWVKDAPKEAAENGNKIVMSPVSTLYFDYVPDKNTINKVYHFNPVPEDFTEEEAKLVMGGQANLWTELVPTENRADYLYFPRATALAEALWSHNYDLYDSYLNRLDAQYERLDELDVHYRLPDLEGFTESNVFTDKAILKVKEPESNLTIHYTMDGTVPTEKSPVLEGPLTITKPGNVKLLAYSSKGLKGDLYTLSYQQQTLAAPVNKENLKPGLKAAFFPESFKGTKGMKESQATDTLVTQNVAVPSSVDAPSFGMQFRGFLNVPEAGIYSFYFTCDDGGVLHIADRLVVDNDGNHSAMEKSGQVALQKGLHPIAVDFIEGGGGFTLKLMYSKDGSKPELVPDSWFSH